MLSKIVDGLSVGIYEEFGDGYEIYHDEDISQGLNTPCFFIAVISAGQSYMLKGRYRQTFSLDIHYFPEVEGSNAEMFSAAPRLLMIAELVTLPGGDLVRGENMRYEVIDGALHFFAEYSVFLRRMVERTDMEEIDIYAYTTED